MPSQFEETSQLAGVFRIDYLKIADGTEMERTVEGIEGAAATLITTRGTGRAAIRVEGTRPRAGADYATDVLLGQDARLQSFASFQATHAALGVRMQADIGEEVTATIIQVTRRGRGLLRKFLNSLPCHLCKRLVRAAITALLASLGIPDITVGDDAVSALLEWLHEGARMHPALAEVLDFLFDGDSPAVKFLDLLRRFLNNLPFARVAQAVCEALGFCP